MMLVLLYKMMADRQSGCEVCVKIYKKSMVAVLINILVMIALITMSGRNIGLIQEQEFILKNGNITEIDCETFCSYQIDVAGQCCDEQSQCVEKEVCLQEALQEKDQEIQGYQFVIKICFILLVLSLVLSLAYICIRCKERHRRRQEELEQRMLEFQEPQIEPNLQLEWIEYVLTNRDEEICAICHDLMWMKRVGELNCRHVFHAECIRQWFESRDDVNTCPICRQVN